MFNNHVAAVVSPSNLFDVLGSTAERTRTFMIGYGDQANYTDTLGWPAIGQDYPLHIGCRSGPENQNADPDVRVDDYHAANANGKMLAYENLVMAFTAPTTAVAGDETAWHHVNDPARLRLIPGNNQIRVVWSDDARGFGGDWAPNQTFLRGENLAIAGYHVYRATTKGGSFTRINPSLIPYKQDTPSVHADAGMEYIDSDVANGSTYWYKIVTVEGSNELVFSDVQSASATASPAAVAVTSIDVRERVPYNSGVWSYTITLYASGSPDVVRLNFDYDRDHSIESPNNGSGQNEVIALSESLPGSGKYVFTTSQTPSSPSTAPGWGWYVEAVKGATTVREPAANFYSTTINNRAISGQYGWMFFSHGNANIQAWMQTSMAGHVAANERCDGTFGDLLVFSMGDDSDVFIPSYNRTNYTLQYKNFLDVLDDANGSLVLNGLPTVAELALGIGDVGDGFLSEGFAVGYGTRAWTGWIRDMMTSAITVVKQYRQPMFIAPRIAVDSNAASGKDREFAFAAYQIVREDRTFYYLKDEAADGVYNEPGDYPEYAIHLGAPVDTTSDNTVGAYAVGGNNRLLRRRFADGVVAMNIYQPPDGGQTRSIDLGGSYYRVTVSGGKIRNGGSATVSTTPVTSVTLGPTEAAVFVTSPQLPETPACSADWVCTAWMTCQSGRQTRSCSDQNSCGTTDRPEESRACTVPGDPANPDVPDGGDGGDVPAADVSPREILVAATAAGRPQIKRFSAAGRLLHQFNAYARGLRGGVHVASGDVDGDGFKEIITGTGRTKSSHIRVFTANGKLHSQFFAFPSTWRTGGSVAAGDVDGDGSDEIIVAPASGAPHLRVFRYNDITDRYELVAQGFAFAKTFRGGVNLASGDVNGDGTDEIVAAPANGHQPQVKILGVTKGKLITKRSFLAYPKSYTTGVTVAVGDVDGNGIADIVTGPGRNRRPIVRFFSGSGRRSGGFQPYPKTHRNGVVVGVVNADNDRSLEVVVTSVASPSVRIYDRRANASTVRMREWRTTTAPPPVGVRLGNF